MNVLLYHRPHSDEEVATADWEQTEQETKPRARAERYNYSDILTAQARGPLDPFLVPADHSWKSRFPLYADFDAIRAALNGRPDEADDNAIDEFPLDVLAMAW